MSDTEKTSPSTAPESPQTAPEATPSAPEATQALQDDTGAGLTGSPDEAPSSAGLPEADAGSPVDQAQAPEAPADSAEVPAGMSEIDQMIAENGGPNEWTDMIKEMMAGMDQNSLFYLLLKAGLVFAAKYGAGSTADKVFGGGTPVEKSVEAPENADEKLDKNFVNLLDSLLWTSAEFIPDTNEDLKTSSFRYLAEMLTLPNIGAEKFAAKLGHVPESGTTALYDRITADQHSVNSFLSGPPESGSFIFFTIKDPSRSSAESKFYTQDISAVFMDGMVKFYGPDPETGDANSNLAREIPLNTFIALVSSENIAVNLAFNKNPVAIEAYKAQDVAPPPETQTATGEAEGVASSSSPESDAEKTSEDTPESGS